MSATVDKFVVPMLMVAATTLGSSVAVGKVAVDKVSVSIISPTRSLSVSVRSLSAYTFEDNVFVLTSFNTLPPTAGRLSNYELGRKLIEIRNRAISNGLTLLTLDEINAEVNKLRGNRDSGDA